MVVLFTTGPIQCIHHFLDTYLCLLQKLQAAYTKGYSHSTTMLTDADMCRCCGQVTDNLKNMNDHCIMMSTLKLIEWFLMFTNLDVNNFCKEHTKICKICELKLRRAHEFRVECLMAERVFSEEKNNPDLFTDYEILDVKEELNEM
jgi:hypothetical protein